MSAEWMSLSEAIRQITLVTGKRAEAISALLVALRNGDIPSTCRQRKEITSGEGESYKPGGELLADFWDYSEILEHSSGALEVIGGTRWSARVRSVPIVVAWSQWRAIGVCVAKAAVQCRWPSATKRGKGGRPETYDWQAAKNYLISLKDSGLLPEGRGKVRITTDLLIEFFRKHEGEHTPHEKTILDKLIRPFFRSMERN